MQELGIYRPSYFFDVFDGFNYEEAKSSSDALWFGSHVTHGQSVVAERLQSFDLPGLGRPVIVQKNNIITDDLPPEITKIAVANLDVDILEGVYHGLVRLAPLIVPGGILIVEDTGHTPALAGAALAVELFQQTPIARQFTSIYMASGQLFLLRNAGF